MLMSTEESPVTQIAEIVVKSESMKGTALPEL